jgi:probable phosphoglycerate mutase
MKILLVRHGRAQGILDHDTPPYTPGNGPLRELGQAQAAAAAADLNQRFKLAAIYASPLHRAMQTAAPIAAGAGLEVQVIPDFREVPPDSTEELEGMQERAWAAIEDLRSRHADDDVIVVASHNRTLHTILCHVLNLPVAEWQRFQINLASVSTIEFLEDGRPVVGLINDCRHLEGIE